MSTEIHIARDFSPTPGARKISDGPFSGEDFRQKHLERLFMDADDNSSITIVLDGTEGYATSFLEEAFGGLARIYGKERCLQRLKFVSEEDDVLVEEIVSYINAT